MRTGLTNIPSEAVLPSGSLRVPHHKGQQYVDDYRAGWKESGQGGDGASRWQDATGSNAYDDGYLDRANRDDQKWHLAWCTSHHNGEGGCGSA